MQESYMLRDNKTNRVFVSDGIRKLRDENAKLKRKLEILEAHGVTIVDAVAEGFEIYSKDYARANDMEAENAKLRELVSGLEYCAQGHICDCCPLYDQSGTNHRRCESLERELGIEVSR